MTICVFGAASNRIEKIYIETTEALGQLMAKRGHALVFGGGSGGVMGAVARGMTAGGGKIIGVAPEFFVDGVLYKQCTEFHSPKTMRQRKQIMDDYADAFIVAPGGVGTFEEFFEIFTLRQLAQTARPLVLLNINGYYDNMLKFLNECVQNGFISAISMTLFYVAKTPEDALDYVEHYVADKGSAEEYRNLG